jgi:hypothetical protein
MESSLIIALQATSKIHAEQLIEMLGDDAPLFEEDVEPQWRDMFNAVEDLLPPEEIINVNHHAIVLSWTCGDIDEDLKDYSTLLTQAGFSQQSIYWWADEDEGFWRISGQLSKAVEPGVSPESRKLIDAVGYEWGSDEDKDIATQLLSMLEKELN